MYDYQTLITLLEDQDMKEEDEDDDQMADEEEKDQIKE